MLKVFTNPLHLLLFYLHELCSLLLSLLLLRVFSTVGPQLVEHGTCQLFELLILDLFDDCFVLRLNFSCL
jgi:hypothetical protein